MLSRVHFLCFCADMQALLVELPLAVVVAVHLLGAAVKIPMGVAVHPPDRTRARHPWPRSKGGIETNGRKVVTLKWQVRTLTACI